MSLDTELTKLISKGLYRIVSGVIGAEWLVKLRREHHEIFDIIRNCDKLFFNDIAPQTFISSGSKAEGFDMKTSDMDFMYVLDDIMVLPSYHPLPQGSIPQKCVLIYDTDCTSPGFTIMRCSFLGEIISRPTQVLISRSLVWNTLGPCVSSKMFKDSLLGLLPSTEIHGPCLSGYILDCEFDHAFCLQCTYWPREASTFITRSLRSGWPSQQVVTDVCNDGCLFVPISGKALHCQDAVEMEWRMSFSLAEKKLVYSMNHCQFLCYGLLKLFLNEVLKKTENINDLLCSYFMKTAVFWEISEDKSGWTSQNFFCKFWKAFCRLLSWVDVGYCPNFFNPDNNMFAGKIHGQKQRLLMEALRSFHSEGLQCLLKCSSLNLKLTKIIQLSIISRQLDIDSYVLLLLNEEIDVPQWIVDGETIRRITSFGCSSVGLTHACVRIHRIINVNPTSTLMKSTLKYVENELLLNIGEIILAELVSANFRGISNRTRKKYLQTALNIVYRNGTTFCESEIIVAKWFYILRMFDNVIHILSSVITRFQCGQFMYEWRMNEAGLERLHLTGTSYNSFMKSNIGDWVVFTFGNTVSEFLLELRAAFDKGIMVLLIPPVVSVNFLLLLSYHHLGDTVRRNEVLRDLHALVWYDNDYHIQPEDRPISWEILGICQQLCGDYHGAYQSYINALNDDDKITYFKSATIIRICCTISQQLND